MHDILQWYIVLICVTRCINKFKFIKSTRCVLSLIAQAKIFCLRFPILLLHSSHLSCTRRKPHLVGGGVHPAVCGERPKNHDFSKFSRDVPLWKIISQDLVGRFGRDYACWKGHIFYFKLKLWNLEFTVFSRFWDIMNVW